MRKPALGRGMMAFAIAASTLSSVVLAPPAFAAGTKTDLTADTSAYTPEWAGLTKLQAKWANGDRRTWTLSVANVTPDSASGDQTPSEFAPGSCTTLRLEWDYANSVRSLPPTFTIGLARPGDTNWQKYGYVDGEFDGFDSGTQTFEMCMDVNAFDGDGGADEPIVGPFALRLSVYGTDSGNSWNLNSYGTAWSCDVVSFSPNCDLEYAEGIISSAGVIMGENPHSNDREGQSCGYVAMGDPADLCQVDYDAEILGKGLPWQRMFESNFPDSEGDESLLSGIEDAVETGHDIILSIKPPAGSNGWDVAADGTYDANLNDYFSNLLALFEQSSNPDNTDQKLIVNFHHEPHDQATDGAPYGWGCTSSCNGTAAEFVAGFRHVIDVFRNRVAIDIAIDDQRRFMTSYIAVASNMGQCLDSYDSGTTHGNTNDCKTASSDSTFDPRRVGGADNLYPGDSYVDIIGVDGYNYYLYDGAGWEELAEEFAHKKYGVAYLAETHQKPLMLMETGSHPGCNGTTDDDPDGGSYSDDTNQNGHTLCHGGSTSSPSRDEWFTNFAKYLEGSVSGTNGDYAYDDAAAGWEEARRWLVGFVYFSNYTTKGNDWRFAFTDVNCPGASCEQYDPDPLATQRPSVTGYQDAFVDDTSHNDGLLGGGDFFRGTSAQF